MKSCHKEEEEEEEKEKEEGGGGVGWFETEILHKGKHS